MSRAYQLRNLLGIGAASLLLAGAVWLSPLAQPDAAEAGQGTHEDVASARAGHTSGQSGWWGTSAGGGWGCKRDGGAGASERRDAQSVAPATQPAAAPAMQSEVVPTAASPSSNAAAPAVTSTSSLREALAASPWPEELWATVERIVACESGGNTNAVGPLGHRGLLQVDPTLHGAVPSDAIGQLTQGYEVYLRQGWGAWTCY